MMKKNNTATIIPDAQRSFSEPLAEMEVHVLAVDDSVIDRRVIEGLLKTSSYKVTTVDSARGALELLGLADSLRPMNLNAFEVHLIITDYCMPGMTGYELLKKIKGTSALKKIPVVVMSSENVPNRIHSCLAEGAEEFLLKPVQLADVKRLKDHVRNCRYATTNIEADASFSKRKAPREDCSEAMSSKRRVSDEELLLSEMSERRVHPNTVIVT